MVPQTSLGREVAARAQAIVRPRYADTIPYDVPASLGDLTGPRAGVVRVSRHIDTSFDRTYDVTDPSMRWSLYSAVVRDGLVSEQIALLDRAWLVELWPELNLPARCRAVWESAFPELAARAA